MGSLKGGYAVASADLRPLTLPVRDGVPDELYERTRRVFSELELVNLTTAIIAINGWNRLSVAFRSPEPGSYTPRA